ncbi:hypothetical protein HMPREF9370_0802 [Neisseria wadsworthii 9715]|uniref:Uncharacterized protein n=1 Tax=Neisseria wadsworthii 9715 TaxID=1030841 RepID=G4CNZ3_9NEIS|nr:hypothetical protein HMPREF9370_0802 [Neisseria wadsworthii 9715]
MLGKVVAAKPNGCIMEWPYVPDGFIGVLAGWSVVLLFALAEFLAVVYCGDGMFCWGI